MLLVSHVPKLPNFNLESKPALILKVFAPYKVQFLQNDHLQW